MLLFHVHPERDDQQTHYSSLSALADQLDHVYMSEGIDLAYRIPFKNYKVKGQPLIMLKWTNIKNTV